MHHYSLALWHHSCLFTYRFRTLSLFRINANVYLLLNYTSIFLRWNAVCRYVYCLVCMGHTNPQNCTFLWGDHLVLWSHPSPHPKRHLDQSAVSLQLTVVSPCTLQCGWTRPPQNCPFLWENHDPDLIHSFLGPPESTTQTASWSVWLFLQGSCMCPTDRPLYICSNRPHLMLLHLDAA